MGESVSIVSIKLLSVGKTVEFHIRRVGNLDIDSNIIGQPEH